MLTTRRAQTSDSAHLAAAMHDAVIGQGSAPEDPC